MAGGTALAQEVPGAGADGRPAGTVDCTQVTVDFTDDPALTAHEKIQRMDQALMRSLAKYEACQNARASAGGAGGGGGRAGEGGMTGSEGDVGTAGATGGAAGRAGSLASTDMTGTEPPPPVPPASELAAPQGDIGDEAATASATDRQPQAAGNGKIPDDIPPADNDSALEAQIRQAAMNEPDPEVRAQLWNEYRKYKGLPPAN